VPYVKLGEGPRARVRYRMGDARAYIAQHVRTSTSDPGPHAANCGSGSTVASSRRAHPKASGGF
jgi:hypothetical protein